MCASYVLIIMCLVSTEAVFAFPRYTFENDLLRVIHKYGPLVFC